MLAQSDYLREEKLRNIDETAELYREILQKGQCVTLKELAVTGSDLIAAGMKPGKELGRILEYFLEVVMEEPDRNTKEELLKLLEEQRQNLK